MRSTQDILADLRNQEPISLEERDGLMRVSRRQYAMLRQYLHPIIKSRKEEDPEIQRLEAFMVEMEKQAQLLPPDRFLEHTRTVDGLKDLLKGRGHTDGVLDAALENWDMVEPDKPRRLMKRQPKPPEGVDKVTVTSYLNRLLMDVLKVDMGLADKLVKQRKVSLDNELWTNPTIIVPLGTYTLKIRDQQSLVVLVKEQEKRADSQDGTDRPSAVQDT